MVAAQVGTSAPSHDGLPSTIDEVVGNTDWKFGYLKWPVNNHPGSFLTLSLLLLGQHGVDEYFVMLPLVDIWSFTGFSEPFWRYWNRRKSEFKGVAWAFHLGLHHLKKPAKQQNKKRKSESSSQLLMEEPATMDQDDGVDSGTERDSPGTMGRNNWYGTVCS